MLDAFALSPAPARPAGFTRTIRNADGTDRLYINTMVTEPGPDLPRHTRGTTLQGCMQGSTLETIALMLGTLHGLTVTAPPGRGKETVEEQVAGTLDEIAMRFGLIVESSPAAS